jgi:hypothetical protein
VRAVATSVRSRAGTPQQRAAQTSVVCRLELCAGRLHCAACLYWRRFLELTSVMGERPVMYLRRPALSMLYRCLLPADPRAHSGAGPRPPSELNVASGTVVRDRSHGRCRLDGSPSHTVFRTDCDCLQGPLVVQRAAAPDLLPALEAVAETGPSGAKV